MPDVIGIAASFGGVGLAEQQPDLAFVDIHLADGPTGVEAARVLTAEFDVKALFMTANAKRIPEDFAGARGVISKPDTERGVRETIADVTAAETGSPHQAQPESMVFVPFVPHDRDECSARRA